MKKIFLNPGQSVQISAAPLFMFKIGLLVCVAWQALGYWMDAPFIFGSQGLFPDSLAAEYYQTALYSFGEHFGKLAALTLMLLSILSCFKKFQSIGFLMIAALEILLLRRNFIFINSGDSALSYLTLVAAFLPAVSWGNRSAKVSLQSLLPLYALNSIVYLINLGFKLSSRWVSGMGLVDSINHLELSRFPAMNSFPVILQILDYLAIVLVAGAVFVPWLSLQNRKVRNLSIFGVVSYHVMANVFMKLSWLSLPFLFFEAALWAPNSISVGDKSPEPILWKTRVGWIVVLLGFFGMKEPGDLSAFTEKTMVPIGHNWYMFAPPPPVTGKWSARISTMGESKTIALQIQEKIFEFFIFQHEYKFFNNLRRSEMLPVVQNFSTWLCRHWVGEKPQSVQLILSLHVFQTGLDQTIEYPETNCSQMSQPETKDPAK